MRLSSSDLDAFARACRDYLGPVRLPAAAVRRGIVQDIDAFIKERTAGQVDERLSLARAILGAFDDHDKAPALAEELYHEMADVPQFQKVVGPMTTSALLGDESHQAMLARNDNFLSMEGLSSFLVKVRPQVCVIVGGSAALGLTSQGTGILIGPDLVLTAAHVVEKLIQMGATATIRAVFGHDDDGVFLDSPVRIEPARGHVAVALHPTDWIRFLSPSIAKDGISETVDSLPAQELAEHLDVAVLRLAERVGESAVQASGGRKRGWVVLVPPPGVPDYGADRRLFMPQHPAGQSMVCDFGRITRQRPCNTRIVSHIESGPGSSGAPCFDRYSRLIALHNAAAKKNQVPEGNQAIRIDAVLPLLQLVLPNEPAPQAVSLRYWNAALPGHPIRPILGRDTLITWVEGARVKEPPTGNLARRILVVDAPVQGSGKSFSIDILRAMLRGQADSLVIVFSDSTQILPDRAEDFAAALARALGVDGTVAAGLPSRPDGATAPGSAADNDKINRWVSNDLPLKLAEMLADARVREVNRTAIAKEIALRQADLGLLLSDEVAALANAPEPIVERQNLWRDAWIVIDDLPSRPISPEVQSLLAVLSGAGGMASLPNPVLGDLRWLFIGHKPDFLTPPRFTLERIGPLRLIDSEVAAVLAAALNAQGLTQDPATIDTRARTIIETMTSLGLSELVPPTTVLQWWQNVQKALAFTITNQLRMARGL